MASENGVHGVSSESASAMVHPLRGVSHGTPGWFDTIYDDHAPLLRAIARRRFNVPEVDVDGLVHDVFASFLTSAPRVRDFRPYLVGGICNASRNYWRRRKRDDSLFVEIDENAICGEDLQHSMSRTLALNAALSRIGDRCRDVLQRYYLENESTETIAEAIGTSPGNVLYILHTCRKRARAFMDPINSPR
jgi:RNA polymerase sigma factor (sigma-70 family)